MPGGEEAVATEVSRTGREMIQRKSEVGLLDDESRPVKRVASSTASLATEAARLIHEQLCEIHSVGELSARLGVSREHLSRSFKRHLGCPIGAFMTALRIERAKVLLGGSMLVKEIAREVGFGSDSSLSRAFAKHVGIHPARYRREFTAHLYDGSGSVSTNRKPDRESG